MDKEEVFFVDKENNYIKWLLIMAIFIGLLALGTYVYYKLTPKNILKMLLVKLILKVVIKAVQVNKLSLLKDMILVIMLIVIIRILNNY